MLVNGGQPDNSEFPLLCWFKYVSLSLNFISLNGYSFACFGYLPAFVYIHIKKRCNS